MATPQGVVMFREIGPKETKSSVEGGGKKVTLVNSFLDAADSSAKDNAHICGRQCSVVLRTRALLSPFLWGADQKS